MQMRRVISGHYIFSKFEESQRIFINTNYLLTMRGLLFTAARAAVHTTKAIFNPLRLEVAPRYGKQFQMNNERLCGNEEFTHGSMAPRRLSDLFMC